MAKHTVAETKAHSKPVALLAEATRHNVPHLIKLLSLTAWMIGSDGPFATVYPSPPTNDIALLLKAVKSLQSLNLPGEQDRIVSSEAAAISAMKELLKHLDAGQKVMQHLRREVSDHSFRHRMLGWMHPNTKRGTSVSPDLIKKIDDLIVAFQRKHDELATALKM